MTEVAQSATYVLDDHRMEVQLTNQPPIHLDYPHTTPETRTVTIDEQFPVRQTHHGRGYTLQTQMH